jgi:rod shape determining protein RodA
MPTADIPAQNIGSRGFAAGAKRLRDDARASVGHFDLPLLFAALGLVGFSVYTLAGATQDDVPGSPNYYVMRQAVFAGVGIVLTLGLMRFDYTRLRELRRPIYALLVASLVAVLLMGTGALGARRWFNIGLFQFQPSEFGKLLLIVVLASFLVDRARDRSAPQTTLAALGLVALPAALVFLQPDLGTALVYGAIAVVMLFIAGVPWQHLAAIGAVVALIAGVALWAAPAAGVKVLNDYQVNRLTSFLHPEDDRAGDAYQQTQAQIAIGAGQRTGRGVEGATQSRLKFLPEHRTDFVFAVIGESYGFAGAATVLTLYALLLWRLLRILASTRDQFGALIVAGVAAIFMFQVFVNVGMNVGIMPITGVTLPMMSYGGSSMIATFISLGLVMAVHAHARAPRTAG